MQNKPSPTNYRKIRRDDERRLVILAVVMLVGVGTGLIGLIWGIGSALVGGLCLLAGAILIGSLWFLLSLIQRLVGDE